MDPVALAAVRSRFWELEVDERRLRENRVRVLVLIGDEDPFYTAAHSLADTLSNVETTVVPGSHRTAPASAEFIDGPLEFLATHDPKPKKN